MSIIIMFIYFYWMEIWFPNHLWRIRTFILTIIVEVNGISDQSSNPGWSYLSFTLLLGKSMNPTILLSAMSKLYLMAYQPLIVYSMPKFISIVHIWSQSILKSIIFFLNDDIYQNNHFFAHICFKYSYLIIMKKFYQNIWFKETFLIK